MAKKKKGKKAHEDEDAPDSRLGELKSVIINETQTREKEAKDLKKTMQPLKRVNSNPLMYDFVPMAKNLFSDSRSVDYGFVGEVEIPNQTFYKEDLPDKMITAKLLKSASHPGQNATASLSFMNNRIDLQDIELLESVKHQSMTQFLERRVGSENMAAILNTMRSYTMLPNDNVSGNAKRHHMTGEGRVQRRFISIIIAIILLLLAVVGTLFGLASAGVYIPFLTDALFPVEIANETTSFVETTTASIDSFVGGGASSEQFFLAKGSELIVTRVEILNIDGTPVNTTFEYVWPPAKFRADLVESLYRKVYEHLGFKISYLSCDDVNPMPDFKAWRVQARVFVQAKLNLGIMYWYGFDPIESPKYGSDYSKRMQEYATELFSSQTNSEIRFIDSFIGMSFMTEAQRYLKKISVSRPPAHIPDEWGHCSGSPVCPS